MNSFTHITWALILLFSLTYADQSFQDDLQTLSTPYPSVSLSKNVGSLTPGFRPKPDQPSAIPGFYDVATKKFSVDAMDITNKHITVFYPTNNPSPSKLIAYAHGYGGGGIQTTPVYWEICEKLSSFGYVVTLHHSCDLGCLSDGKIGFDYYYYEQLKAITWVEEMKEDGEEEFVKNLDLDDGVAIAGHSMGGQATLFSSAYNSTSHNIKAAAYHHAWTEDFPTPEIPFISFTSYYDDEAPQDTMGLPIYEIETEGITKAVVSTQNYGHHEADILGINPLLAQFTVAWFKVLFDGLKTENGVDWEEMIFGRGKSSVCGGGIGGVVEGVCEVMDLR